MDGSEMYVAVQDDDDLELAMAMVMSERESSARTITFVVKFEKDLPSLEDERTAATSENSHEVKMIDTCASEALNSSDFEPSKDFLKLIDHDTDLLEKNARDIFSSLCANLKIGSMYEDERKTKKMHPLAEEFEKAAEQVFKEVLYSRDLEEQDEDQTTIMDMA